MNRNPPCTANTRDQVVVGRSVALTNVILQAESKFGPQHDEGEGCIEVHIIRVIHPVLLSCKMDVRERKGEKGGVGTS